MVERPAPHAVRRRVLAVAGAALLVAIVLALVIGVMGGDDPERPDQLSPAELSQLEKSGKLPKAFTNVRVGVTVGVPSGWKAKREAGKVELKRRDGTAIMSVSAPGPKRDAEKILKRSVEAIRGRYRKAEITATEDRELAGLPARSVALSAVNRKGTPIRALAIGAEGKRRAYLVNLFVPARRSEEQLVQSQLILNSMALVH